MPKKIVTIQLVWDSSGNTSLDVGQGWFQSVFLEDVPKDIAKTLNKSQVIEFEATVRSVSTFLGL